MFGLVGSTVVFQRYLDLIATKKKRSRRMEDSEGGVAIPIPYISRGCGRRACEILRPRSSMAQSDLGTGTELHSPGNTRRIHVSLPRCCRLSDVHPS